MNFEIVDITQYTGGDYKPWWIACTKGDLSKFHGFNGGNIGDLVDNKLQELADSGKIIKGKHYLAKVKVEITEYEKPSKSKSKPFFRTEADLIKIENPYGLNSTQFFVGYRRGVTRAFVSLQQRRIFYEIYKGNANLLKADKKDIWQIYEDWTDKAHDPSVEGYREWLIDFCFGGI